MTMIPCWVRNWNRLPRTARSLIQIMLRMSMRIHWLDRMGFMRSFARWGISRKKTKLEGQGWYDRWYVSYQTKTSGLYASRTSWWVTRWSNQLFTGYFQNSGHFWTCNFKFKTTSFGRKTGFLMSIFFWVQKSIFDAKIANFYSPKI